MKVLLVAANSWSALMGFGCVLCVCVCVCVWEREKERESKIENQSKGTLSSVDECLPWAVPIISWAVCVQRRCRDMLMRWRSAREEGAAWRTFRLTLSLIVCLESCCKVGEICLIVPQSCSCLESSSDVKLLWKQPDYLSVHKSSQDFTGWINYFAALKTKWH